MFYAMDWMSQINFYNHYINHNIIYVTGGTGTGKSTQVPKLLMYSLKMYDYKADMWAAGCCIAELVKKVNQESGLTLLLEGKGQAKHDCFDQLRLCIQLSSSLEGAGAVWGTVIAQKNPEFKAIVDSLK